LAGFEVSLIGRFSDVPRGKIESAPEPGTGFVLMLGNGRRIASGWGFGDAELARLIRVAETT